MFVATILIKECTSGTKAQYRSDIDGLRALACLAVVIFHAFPDCIKGGFTGVDIFFVISGFLISSIIYRNIFNKENPGHVNIVDFYIRRVRRIFPALIAVLIAVLVLSFCLLQNEELKRIGKHVFAGSTYLSNIMLYFESGNYFNVESNQKPLLHLWSLGVEEQFYLIFPLFLWALYKIKFHFLFALTLFSAISFVGNLYAVNIGKSSYAFYMPWTRFWELSLGAVLAYAYMFRPKFLSACTHKTTSNILSISGLVLIIFGYFTIQNSGNFPGSIALIPVVGSMLIIAAGKEGFINKYVLSSKVFIFFGLISYPLYLWHWPLLSFAYILSGDLPLLWIRTVAVILAIVLATLTFYFIEPPLRYGSRPKFKALALFIVVLVIGLIGLVLSLSNNHGDNLNQKAINSEKIVDIKPLIEKCNAVFPNWSPVGGNDLPCMLTNDDGHNDIAIIGDSHAGEIAPSLITLFGQKHSLAVLPTTCMAPLINIGMDDEWRSKMHQNVIEAYDYVLSHDEIKLVIMAHLPNGKEYDVENKNLSTYDGVYQGALRTFKKLKEANKEVMVIVDHPGLPFNPAKNTHGILRNLFYPKYRYARTHYENDVERNNYYHPVIKAAHDFDNVTVVELTDLFCDAEFCYSKNPWTEDGEDMFRDNNHVNVKGADMVAKYIDKEIDKVFDKINKK